MLLGNAIKSQHVLWEAMCTVVYMNKLALDPVLDLE